MTDLGPIEKSVLSKVKVFPAWDGYSDLENKASEYDAHVSFGDKYVYSVAKMRDSLQTLSHYQHTDRDLLSSAKNQVLELVKDINSELGKMIELNKGNVTELMQDRFVMAYTQKNKAKLVITVPDMWFPISEN